MSWQRMFYLLLAIALTMTPVFLPGCTEDLPTEEGLKMPLPEENGPQPFPEGYPPYSFEIQVPWMSQVPPKNANDTMEQAWDRTNNCGQACCVMLGGYFNHGSTEPWVITAENEFLHCPTPYGCTTGASTLQYLLREFHALRSNYYIGNGPDDVVMEGANGRPVIVGVRTRMGQYTGRPHWMLFVGWDGNWMYFHDPGRTLPGNGDPATGGRFVRYSVDKFLRSWNNQGRKYIPVYR